MNALNCRMISGWKRVSLACIFYENSCSNLSSVHSQACLITQFIPAAPLTGQRQGRQSSKGPERKMRGRRPSRESDEGKGERPDSRIKKFLMQV